jgi:hypothetical protein
MTLKLIIISRYQNENFINNVKSYNLATEENTVVIYPTNDIYETTLIKPELVGFDNYLIINDWSISMEASPATNVDNILAYFTSGYDVVYLGKYLDTCNRYNSYTNIDNFTLVTGTEPIGFNAVLISNSYAVKLIEEMNKNIYYTINYAMANLNLTSETPLSIYAVSPNIFVYNPLYNTIDLSKSYGVKTSECQMINPQVIPPSDNDLTIFWILLIIVAVCIILWLLLNFTSFGINTKYIEKSIKQNYEVVA